MPCQLLYGSLRSRRTGSGMWVPFSHPRAGNTAPVSYRVGPTLRVPAQIVLCVLRRARPLGRWRAKRNYGNTREE
eukprot:scaffold191485_cov27-Tisochrysis_lutea.AAC.2